ncbi:MULTISPECIES: hypothetical protein [Burkholderia cepacia complex]|uniref:hypothetical protein n=1 Tax=Burkholderia cepacia complex TaxID=87882 RepID=UPI00115F9DCF|nr:hypothetical protein [Burkholderia cenocepacia]
MMLAFLNAVMSANLLTLSMTVFVVLTIFLTSEDISKTGAILLGSVLIAQAGWTAYQIQVRWLPIAEAMTAAKVATNFRMSPEQVKTFTSSANFLLWIIPFATASWGTNIISDAISRNFTYREKWSAPHLAWKVVVFIVSVPIGLISLILSFRRDETSETDTRLDESPRGSLRRSSRALIRLLANLPQFHKDESNDDLVNLLDGSVVRAVRLDDNEFGCYLSVKWPNQATAIRVDGDRYVQLQIKTADTLGHDTTGLRHKAKRYVDEVLGI